MPPVLVSAGGVLGCTGAGVAGAGAVEPVGLAYKSHCHEILDESPMEVTSYTSTSVDATITASADGRVVTTIPYDTGWTVTVDGKTVDMTAFKDTFVSFEISEGTHTIHLDYTPDGFYLGLASTLICIILLITIRILSMNLR